MPKFKLTVHKVYDVDTSTWGDLGGLMKDAIETIDGNPKEPSKEELHNAMRHIIEDDISSAIDLGDIDDGDVEIEVIE